MSQESRATSCRLQCPIALFLCQRMVYHRDTEDAEFHRESLCVSVSSVSLWLRKFLKCDCAVTPGTEFPFR